MNDENRTIATDDGRWFDVADAVTWLTCDGSKLFHVGKTWARRDMLAELENKPAVILTEQEAVVWITSRGFEIPDALAAIAETSRISVRSDPYDSGEKQKVLPTPIRLDTI